MHNMEVSSFGEKLLNDPLLNKGTAFTQQEREEFELLGLLPHGVSTIEEQAARRLLFFHQQQSDIAKNTFLTGIQNRNETLFYRLVLDNAAEMLPYIYTPTVGDVSLQYSVLYTHHRGLYLSYPLKKKIPEIFANFPRDIDVIVVTDGERVLGLGDLGVGGMAISVGKLALYTLFGGIYPGKTLPIVLDVGTNNEKLLKDPEYLGWQHERLRGKEYDDFIEAFVHAVKKRFPKVLLQWEDFAKPNARPLLDRYRDQILSFNDDIQGTAAVTLAAILASIKGAKALLKEQRIVIFGGGSAGIGISEEIVRTLRQEGVSEKEALENIYIIDVQGLIHTGLSGIDPMQKRFTQPVEKMAHWRLSNPKKATLQEVVHNVHPTILIGVSGQAGAFTEEIIRAMGHNTPRPIIFPLSNPTSQSEAHPRDILEWTEGRAIIATGSPFKPVQFRGKPHAIAQCNNVYIFPAVGLGALAAGAHKVTDGMFLKAATALSGHAPILKDPNASIFPPIDKLRSVTRLVALEVAMQAQEDNVAPKRSREETLRLIDANIWYPSYAHYKRAR